MRIATWNVNSIKSRLEHVISFLKNNPVNILLIQELKCVNESFPYEEIKKAGYNCYVNGQKAWNGVAILSKETLNTVSYTHLRAHETLR